MPQINSSWRWSSLAFQLQTDVDSQLLSQPAVLERVREDLEYWGVRIVEPSADSFRFKYRSFTWRRSSIYMVTGGVVRSEQVGERTVLTITGSFLGAFVGGLVFSVFCVVGGLPLYLAVGMTWIVALFNGFQAYSWLRKVMTKAVATSTMRAA